MTKKVAVVLSGCGYLDGAEIHESVCSLLALDRAGADIACFAPDVDFDVVDHRTGEATGETRNCLVEAARIARGRIEDVAEAKVEDFDALVLPGGFGAAKNLCSFAADGPECTVHEETAALIRGMHEAGKPIAAICIAPALIARVLGSHEPSVTIGNDAGTASAVESLGARHVDCPVDRCVVDELRKVVTAPAYMYDTWVADAERGIAKAVEAALAMA